MNARDDIRIYNESCEPFEDLLRHIERRSASRLGLSIMPVDGRYAAGVWKRLFVLTLKRMATNQPSLARFTAVEALGIVGSSACSSFSYPKTAAPRHLLTKLKKMTRQSLRGLTGPRKGFHPEDLQHWLREGLRAFKDGVEKRNAVDLWKRCSRGLSRMPENLIPELKQRRTPRSRAMAFVARLAGVDEEGLKVTLSRRKKAMHSLQ
jgi:hypothetical protein